MSHYTETNVTVTQSHLDRLTNQLSKAQQQNRNWQGILKQLEQTHNKRVQQIQTQNIQIQTNSQNVVNALQSDIKQIEKNNSNRLNKLRKEYNDVMQKQEVRHVKDMDDLKKNINNRLKIQRKEYLEIEKKQQKDIKHIKTEINTIKNRDANTKGIVQTRLKDVITVLDDVIKNYPHTKYTPGKVDKIQNRLARANNDLQNKDANLVSGVNASIWEAYDDIMELREEIIKKQAEFEREYEAALNHLAMLLEISKDENLHLGKESLKKEIDKIDYWTEGEFKKVTTQLNEMHKLLENNKNSLSFEEVKDLQQQISSLEQKQKEVLDKAIENVIKSQNRKGIAKNVTAALIKSGYQIVSANGYEGNDPRKKFEVVVKKSQLENATETIIIADENEKLIINTTDNVFPDEESARQESERITKAINPNHNDIGQVSCVEPQHRKDLTSEKVKESLKPGKSLNI